MTAIYVILIVAAVLVLLYFLMIMPRLTRQQDWKQFPKVYYAHRGLHDNHTEAPENSMAAFKKVVFHDFTLQRATGKSGKVCEYTYEELQEFPLFESEERIPKFENVLAAVNGRVPLIVEIKLEWMDLMVCTLTNRALADYKGQYCIESFNPLALMWYRRYRNDVLRGQLSDGFLKTGEFKGPLYFILQNLLLNWMTRPDFVAYDHKYADNLSRRLCRKLYHNMAVAWTIKSQKELEEAEKSFDMFIFDSFIPRRKRPR